MARNPLTPYRSGGLLGGFDDIFSLHREVNRLFDSMMGSERPAAAAQGGGGSGSIISARMNVSETEGEIRVSAELPGVAESDIDVSLDDDVLTIRGEKKLERQGERESFHFVERSFGTFQRSLRLPFPVDPEQVRASFENGVLTVTLPKAAQLERSRRIEVRRGASGGAQTIEASAEPSGGPSGQQPQMGGHVGTMDQPQAGEGGAQGEPASEGGSMGSPGP